PVWVRHRVQMVEVTEELVEAVQGRQILVQVAQMVLAKLAGCITKLLQHCGQRRGLIRDAHVSTGLAYCRKTGAEWYLACDEVGPTRCAACLGIIVGK